MSYGNNLEQKYATNTDNAEQRVDLQQVGGICLFISI